MKILLIEDDMSTSVHISRALSSCDHEVDSAADGASGLMMSFEAKYDLLVVDRLLPKLDGLSLVRTLRQRGRCTPVLMLSALGEVDARVDGLEAGADDYLPKPFSLIELRARVAALARRPPLAQAALRLTVADLELDLVRREVHRAGRRIDVQPREFRLLEYLMRSAGKVVTKSMLLEQVWEYYFDPGTSIVETHVSRLRAKIDRGFDVPLLITVRGAGYSLRAAH